MASYRNTSGLRPWPKGVSGNPGGRPKTLPVADAIKAELAKKKGKVENAQLIAKKLVELAIAGDLEAIKILADRAEGKPMQRGEFSGPEGGPIPLEIPQTREELERRVGELLNRK